MLIMSAKRATAIVLLALVTVAGCGGDDKPKAKADDALKRGLAAHVAGDTDKALDLYNEVLETDDDNKYALYNIGLIRQNANNIGEAEKLYRQVLEVDPNYAPALFNLAVIEYDSGNNTEAVELYRRVIAITPKDANAHLNLGFALKALGRHAEGDKALAEAVRLNPELKSRIPKGGASASPQSQESPSG